MVVAALLGLVGCGGGDDQLDREQLVPKGMRRTTVTASDARTGANLPTAAPAREPATESVANPPDVAETPTEQLAAPPAELAAPPAVATAAFVVQAGAFKQPATAEGVVAKLRGLGITALIETVQVRGVTFHRVVVPGLADRAAADALAARLKQELGIDAVVRTP
jgi:cell division septation protein DedD